MPKTLRFILYVCTSPFDEWFKKCFWLVSFMCVVNLFYQQLLSALANLQLVIDQQTVCF